MKKISVVEFENLSTGGAQILIDVRTPGEFQSSHLEGAKNIPLGSAELDQFIQTQSKQDKPIYVLCQSGKRAESVCNSFANINDKLVLVEGGMNACKMGGLSTIEEKATISLDRQVRIAAGLLVVLGVILSQVMLPNAIYLSALVGAGLIFAGITDTCGMGMMLARMPWNNACNTSCCKK